MLAKKWKGCAQMCYHKGHNISFNKSQDISCSTHQYCKHQEEMVDIQNDDIFKYAHVISINETHLSPTDKLTPQVMHLTPDFTIFRKDRNNTGGGVALIVINH